MCGIAGAVLPAGESPSPERLSAIRDQLMHRGPDGSGIEILDNVGLVHTRLAIVDVSERASQPMRHPGGSWWISFNGEIFNHKSLRGELAGETFVSGGDTETLLHSLARWGPSVLPRLNGQFAFAALDRSTGRLLLARDRFGIKPLYLAQLQGGIWFASEPSALIAAGLDPSPRARGWEGIFDWSCYSGEETLIAGIRRLPPGSCTEISIDTLEMSSTLWDSPASHVDPERQCQLRSSRRSTLVSELEGTLRNAVHDALLGDVPMGTLCSGGVDSSLITALAVEVNKDLVAFNARYKGDTTLDEGPAAQRVADALKIELDLLEVTKPSWRGGFVPATVHFGAPIATASSVAISQMAERARLRGIKVLLTGEGADELFAGYSDLHAANLEAFLSPARRTMRKLEPFVFGPPAATLAAILDGLRSTASRAVRLKAIRPPKRTPEATEYPDGGNSVDDEAEKAYRHHAGPRRALEVELLRRLDFTLSHLLNRMDTNMMQACVEARVPFLDPRVVELALNLPLEVKVSPWSKAILRQVARRLLPLSIAQRPKIYGMDFDAGAWIEDAADPRFLSEGIFRELFEIPARQFKVIRTITRGTLLVRLWSTEVWCRAVFAGHDQSTIEKDLFPQGP